MDPARRNEKQSKINIFNRRVDEMIEKKQTDKQLLAIIQQKNTQIAVLNHVNTRLGAELVILQKKLGIDHDTILKQIQNVNDISVAFHFETEQLQYLDALLTAYDNNNLKQKKLIAHLYTSLEDAENRTQNLVRDNEFLLGEMQDKTKQILQIYSKGFVDDNLNSSYSKLQRETEVEIMENIRTQNEYLLQNYRELEDKLEKKEHELKQSLKNSNHFFELYKKQSDDLKQSLIKIDDLIKIKDVLERKFDEVTQENIELETLREQLEIKITRLENETKELRNQFQLQKTLKHEEVERINQQFSTLRLQHEASEKRERELFNKSMLAEKNLQNQKDELKMMKRQLEKTKSDFQQTLKMCEAYENKINVYAKKEVIVKETIQDCKQKLENALVDRDKAIMKEKQLERLIESIKQKNRMEMQTLKTTFEKLIYELNQKIRILEQDKEDNNSVFYQNQCALKHQIEKLKRDYQMLKDENHRNAESIKSNSGSQIITKLKELEQKNQNLSRQLNQKERTYREGLENKEDIIKNLEDLNKKLARDVDKQRLASREANNQRTQYRSKISMLQKQRECLQEEVSKLKRSIDSRASAQNEEKQARIRELEDKLNEAIQKQKMTKQKTIELLQKNDEAQQQYQAECQNKIITLETQIKKLRRKLEKQKK